MAPGFTATYKLIITFRKIFCSIAVVFFYNYPIIQSWAIFTVYCLYFGYLLKFDPVKFFKFRPFIMTCDTLTLITHFFMLVMAHSPESSRDNAAIGFIIFMYSVPIFTVLYVGYHLILLIIKMGKNENNEFFK
jgi:hypothetical protein